MRVDDKMPLQHRDLIGGLLLSLASLFTVCSCHISHRHSVSLTLWTPRNLIVDGKIKIVAIFLFDVLLGCYFVVILVAMLITGA